MRDWIFMAAPLAAFVYFIFHPDQIAALVAWLENLFR